jgi:hypothetical protein
MMTKAREANTDPLLAILEWRNTPSEQLGPSPAQILMGRRTRSRLPTSNKLLETPLSFPTNRALANAKERQAYRHITTVGPKNGRLSMSVRRYGSSSTTARTGERLRSPKSSRIGRTRCVLKTVRRAGVRPSTCDSVPNHPSSSATTAIMNICSVRRRAVTLHHR